MIQGGILQFQLCIELSQVCSLKLYRTQHDFKLKLKSTKHQHTKERDEHSSSPNDGLNTVFSHLDFNDHKEEGSSSRKSITGIFEFNKGRDKLEVEALDLIEKGPTIYPCMEIVVLHSRR